MKKDFFSKSFWRKIFFGKGLEKIFFEKMFFLVFSFRGGEVNYCSTSGIEKNGSDGLCKSRIQGNIKVTGVDAIYIPYRANCTSFTSFTWFAPPP